MRKPTLSKSFKNAFAGLFHILRSERNFKIHILALLLNLFLIVIFRLNPTDASVILLVCFVVMITETLNTVAEKICDFIHLEYHENIGLIKDIAAASVLLSSFVAVLVGLLIYSKYLW